MCRVSLCALTQSFRDCLNILLSLQPRFYVLRLDDDDVVVDVVVVHVNRELVGTSDDGGNASR